MSRPPVIEGEIRCKRCGREIGVPELNSTYVHCVNQRIEAYFCEKCQTPDEKVEAPIILAAIDADVAGVAAEFIEVLNDLAGIHAILAGGVHVTQGWVVNVVLPHANSPESKLFALIGGPSSDDPGWAYQQWPIQELPDRLAPDGPVMRELGRQWVVMVASQWNDHFRKRLAEANRMKTSNAFNDPGFADINRMRNDIVHHRGIATDRNTGRCERLRWFAPGEPIFPTVVHVADFMHYVGRMQRLDNMFPGSTWRPVWGI